MNIAARGGQPQWRRVTHTLPGRSYARRMPPAGEFPTRDVDASKELGHKGDSDRPRRGERDWGGPSTSLILVRHGQVESDVEGTPMPLHNGHGNPSLSAIGRHQAELVAPRLAALGPDAIYASCLHRAAQSAEPLAALTGISPVADPDLREVFLGEWEAGVYRRKLAEGHPLVTEIFHQQRWDLIPGAERHEDFSERVERLVRRITSAHEGETVVLFTHAGFVAEILARATGSQRFAFIGSDNASVSELLVAQGRRVLRRFNDISHLELGSQASRRIPSQI